MYDIIVDDTFKLDWLLLFKWFIDILNGIAYLHNFTPCILHRDIKSKNLLVCEQIILTCNFAT
jgi:serine/threonine protein kinase